MHHLINEEITVTIFRLHSVKSNDHFFYCGVAMTSGKHFNLLCYIGKNYKSYLS